MKCSNCKESFRFPSYRSRTKPYTLLGEDFVGLDLEIRDACCPYCGSRVHKLEESKP